MSEFVFDRIHDPLFFAENKMPAHSDHVCYRTEEEHDERRTSLRMCLNGTWKFLYGENDAALPRDFYETDFNAGLFDTIEVPSHIQMQGYDVPHYTNTTYPWEGREEVEVGKAPVGFNPTACYLKQFTVPKAWEGQPVFISFQGVESGMALWLNGAYVGYAEDSFDAADFDLTEYLVPGENSLAVKVFKWTSSSWFEDQDFFRFSGIYRDVYLYTEPGAHIRDIKMKPTLSKDLSEGEMTAQFLCTGAGSIQLTLYDAREGELYRSLEKAKSGRILFQNRIAFDADSESENGICTACTSYKLDAPKAWSAENPFLYLLKIEVFDRSGNLTEVMSQNVGFRRFEMIDGIMCLNGKRIVFHGVNRHEFSAVKGRVPVYRDMLLDIITMKQNNIDAIRTSHYPNCSCVFTDGAWEMGIYELCDVFGLYMIAENNMETHGSWEGEEREGEENPLRPIPCDDETYLPMLIDRVDSYYETNKNHPSVLIWSLGNESFGGSVIHQMAMRFRAHDDSRLIHYEGIFHDRRYPDSSDMESQMYPSVAAIREFLDQNREKPFICCEYTHAMGNSCGGMHLYTDLTEENPRYQGGFIWDYIDQTILTKNSAGEDYYAYGGDFGDRPSDYEFSGNGICYGDDRSPSPKMQEVKYNYRTIRVAFSEDGTEFLVRNRNLFRDLSEYDMHLILEKDGISVCDQVAEIQVLPLQEERVFVPEVILKKMAEDSCAQWALTVSFVKKQDTLWCEKGHEVAISQFVYPVSDQKKHVPDESLHASLKKLTVVNGVNNIGVQGDHFSCLFSAMGSGLVSYVYRGREMLQSAIKPNFWRAPTSNDTGNLFQIRYSQWKLASLYLSTKSGDRFASSRPKVTEDVGSVLVEYRYFLPTTPAASCDVSYRVFGDGRIETTLHYDPVEGLGDMPEFGMIIPLDASCKNVTYYGLGPLENYVDRCEGARLGIYSTDAVSNVSRYLMPQECGNRCKVRWADVVDENGIGLRFSGDDFSLSVLPYTPHEMEEASHPYELPTPYRTIVRTSLMQMGIGGDDSWGARTLDQYLIDLSKPLTFTFSLCGIEKGAQN